MTLALGTSLESTNVVSKVLLKEFKLEITRSLFSILVKQSKILSPCWLYDPLFYYSNEEFIKEYLLELNVQMVK